MYMYTVCMHTNRCLLMLWGGPIMSADLSGQNGVKRPLDQ